MPKQKRQFVKWNVVRTQYTQQTTRVVVLRHTHRHTNNNKINEFVAVYAHTIVVRIISK